MKNTWNDFVKPIVVLGVICLVTSKSLFIISDHTKLPSLYSLHSL